MKSLNKIKEAITSNTIHPSQFELTKNEFDHLNEIQDNLFDKLNDFNLTFIPSNSDTILVHYIIAKRIQDSITINKFIQLYTEITPLLK